MKTISFSHESTSTFTHDFSTSPTYILFNALSRIWNYQTIFSSSSHEVNKWKWQTFEEIECSVIYHKKLSKKFIHHDLCPFAYNQHAKMTNTVLIELTKIFDVLFSGHEFKPVPRRLNNKTSVFCLVN